jgi:hypothetical protein
MKSLWLGSFLFLFLACCSTKKISKWTEAPGKSKVFENYFDSTNTPVRYKADISVYGRFFSGILFVKFLNDTTCHVALTSMLGTKLFEMRITPKTDTTIECFERMNRSAVLKGIEKNIRIFVMSDNFIKETQIFENEEFSGIMWRKYTPSEIYQYYQPEGGPINKIELMSKSFSKKIVLDVKSFNGSIPSDIYIKNYTFKLSIHLTQL